MADSRGRYSIRTRRGPLPGAAFDSDTDRFRSRKRRYRRKWERRHRCRRQARRSRRHRRRDRRRSSVVRPDRRPDRCALSGASGLAPVLGGAQSESGLGDSNRPHDLFLAAARTDIAGLACEAWRGRRSGDPIHPRCRSRHAAIGSGGERRDLRSRCREPADRIRETSIPAGRKRVPRRSGGRASAAANERGHVRFLNGAFHPLDFWRSIASATSAFSFMLILPRLVAFITLSPFLSFS